MRHAQSPPVGAHLLRVGILTVAAAYGYVVSEWLFFVTKPSALSALPPLEALQVLVIAPLGPLGVAALALLLLVPCGRGLRSLGARVPGEWFAIVAPAALLTATGILLIENFTKTVLGFYVGSVLGPARYVYALGFAALLVWTARTVARWVRSPGWVRWTRSASWAAGAATAISLIALVLAASPVRQAGFRLSTRAPGRLPNIVILVGDGVESRRMSALGFERRDTTPFIRSLLPESLVFENHFTNAANTTGSVGSLLSGRLPTQSRVIFPPDVFRGADAYRHLPAILRTLGYYSGDISVRHYADAYDMNLRSGFQYANSRSLESPGALREVRAVHPSTSLFLEESYDRLAGRLRHAFGLADLVDPFDIVTQRGRLRRSRDPKRIAELLEFLDRAPEPFFVHVHLLVAHGGYFYPRTRLFSKGKRQKKPQKNAFYDDALRDYDISVAEVVGYLRDTGKYDRTLLVLNSDHGRRHSTRENLPLIMKLPGGGRTGRVRFNTQRVDIAPTLLDYIGVEVPEWMAGESLLSGELDPMRPLVQARSVRSVLGLTGTVAISSPPFHTLGLVGAVYCHWWYELDVRSSTFSKGVITSHTAPCYRRQRPRNQEVRRFLVDHLRQNGYDVSSLVPAG